MQSAHRRADYISLIAACAAVINGRGNIPCHHNFGVLFATAFQLTVRRLVRVAVEPQIPVEAVLGDKNLGDKGFHYTFGDVFAFVTVGVLFQCILENGQLFSVVYDSLGFGLLLFPRPFVRTVFLIFALYPLLFFHISLACDILV